jgi:3-oxoacyl-[acyl-carrier protein] reductase
MGATVNTVSPGYTVSGMLRRSTFRKIGEHASPLKRLGMPKDIADVVTFVVSEEARWLAGQDIHAAAW